MVELKTKAEIIEIFSSIQGEGIYVGQSQIFIRFARCNLNCSYCDVPSNIKVKELSLEQILVKISKLSKSKVISLTGGEALGQVLFLEKLLPILKRSGYKIYLETNGTLVRSLARVIKWIDVIAMDLKLPTSTGQKGCWTKHSQFLQTIFAFRRKIEVFVKVVVSSKTSEDDFKRAVNLIKKNEQGIRTPFIIQPVCWGTGKKMKIKISLKKLLEFESLAGSSLTDVRVIPQTHKILGFR